MKKFFWLGACLVLVFLFYKKPAPKPQAVPQQIERAPQSQKEIAPPVLTTVIPPTNNKRLENPEHKMKILDEILASKNDNDSRLDTEFNNLSDADKTALRDKYFAEPKEHLNERGTMVFLLGREIKNTRDMAFIKNVLDEPTCKSFEFCSKTMADPTDEHHGADEITLSYPQVVALKSIAGLLQKKVEAPLKNQALGITQEAAKSPNEIVKSLAQDILDNTHLLF